MGFMTILVRLLVILATVGVTWSLAILGWGGAEYRTYRARTSRLLPGIY